MDVQNLSNAQEVTLSIVYADDDSDEHYIFKRVLNSLPFRTKLIIVEDGNKLMKHLSEHSEKLPDVLFLDYNMPFKNGAECLSEIKLHPKLNNLPIIIYSNGLQEKVADELFESGAHFCVQKSGLEELQKALQIILTHIIANTFKRPVRTQFMI